MVATRHLNSTIFPPGTFRRRRYVAPSRQAPDSEAKYDFTTFFYDAIRNEGTLTLVCPKLLNFCKLAQRGVFHADNQRLNRPRIRDYYRHSLIKFRVPGQPKTLSFEVDGTRLAVAISTAEHELFAGLNTELLVSRDNDLDWIGTHVRHHVVHHGLKGVVFFDNGSTRYGLGEIAKELEKTGVQQAVVIDAPMPFGGTNKPGQMHRELFLQTALYNVARLRFLGRARAVLRMDPDEILAEPPTHRSVFDEACGSRFGFVRSDGV